MTCRRLTRCAVGLVGVLVLAGSVSSCSALSSEDKEKSTTCSQFAEMDAHTGLMGLPSDDQTDAITSMLEAHGKGTDDSNVKLAYLKIIQYFNIYEGQSGSH